MPMSHNINYQEPSAGPVAHYLNRLSQGSHKYTLYRLDKVARYLSDGRDNAFSFAWPTLDKSSAVNIQSWLWHTYRPTTIDHILFAVRGVIKQTWRLGLITEEEYYDVRQGLDNTLKSKSGQRPNNILTNRNIHKLFNCCATLHTRSARRNEAMLAMLYGANMAPTEVLSLHIEDYDFQNSRINIPDSHTPRTIYLNADVQEILKSWLLHRGTGAGPLLCPVLKNDTVQIRLLSYQSLTNICSRLSKAAKIPAFKPRDLNKTHRQHLQDRQNSTLEIPRP